MKAIHFSSSVFAVAALGAALVFVIGCGQDNPPGPPPKSTAPPPKNVSVGSNVKMEVQGDKRRVLINAQVCQQDGPLEVILTHTRGEGSKTHEALLKADVDAREIHSALLLAGAKPGHPVKFEPKFQPADGQKINVLFQYEENGKQHTVPANSWLRTHEKKPVELEWIFTGSALVPDPNDWTKKRMLAQDEGSLIGLGAAAYQGSASALIDLKGGSGKTRDELDFEYFTERIPPRETKVTIILEPVGEYKPGK
jgi:hypothetical protein